MKNIDIDKYYAIPMIEFLTNFVGMDELNKKEFNLLKRATHQDITELSIPYVKRVPIETITEEDIMVGRIIIVADGKSTDRRKRYAPYIRPSILKEKEKIKKLNS